jgi:hypothetical protein
MALNLSLIIYLLVLSAVTIIGALRYRYLDKGLVLFFYLMLVTLVSELTAYYFVKHGISKTPIFHIYAVIHISGIIYFFVYSNSIRIHKLMLLLVILSPPLLGLVNVFCFQPLQTINSNTILFDCFLSICLSLYSLFLIGKNDDIRDVFLSPHFYIWTSTLMLWTSTFFFWALLSHLNAYKVNLLLLQTIINILIYCIVAFAFYKTKNVKLADITI